MKVAAILLISIGLFVFIHEAQAIKIENFRTCAAGKDKKLSPQELVDGGKAVDFKPAITLPEATGLDGNGDGYIDDKELKAWSRYDAFVTHLETLSTIPPTLQEMETK